MRTIKTLLVVLAAAPYATILLQLPNRNWAVTELFISVLFFVAFGVYKMCFGFKRKAAPYGICLLSVGLWSLLVSGISLLYGSAVVGIARVLFNPACNVMAPACNAVYYIGLFSSLTFVYLVHDEIQDDSK